MSSFVAVAMPLYLDRSKAQERASDSESAVSSEQEYRIGMVRKHNKTG